MPLLDTPALSPVTVRLPGDREAVGDILARAGRSSAEQRIFDRIYELRTVPVMEAGQQFEDLLLDAALAALDGGTVQLVLYGHTLLVQPMSYLPGFADRLRATLGLPDVPVYGISQMACTSVLRSIVLAERFLRRPGGSATDAVLVLGGDQGSFGGFAQVIPGVTVSGDGAVAFVVRAGQGRYRYLAEASVRATRYHRSLLMSRDEAREFGRASAEHMVETAHRAAAAAGRKLAELDWLMPHHNNAMFWRGFSRETGYPQRRIHLDLLPELGHSFGSDSLLALEHADRAGLLRPGDLCLLTSIGQGSYFHAVVVEVMAPC